MDMVFLLDDHGLIFNQECQARADAVQMLSPRPVLSSTRAPPTTPSSVRRHATSSSEFNIKRALPMRANLLIFIPVSMNATAMVMSSRWLIKMHFMRGGPPHGKVELAYSEPFFGSLRSLHPLTVLALSFGMVRYAHYIRSLRLLYLLAWFATLTISSYNVVYYVHHIHLLHSPHTLILHIICCKIYFW